MERQNENRRNLSSKYGCDLFIYIFRDPSRCCCSCWFPLETTQKGGHRKKTDPYGSTLYQTQVFALMIQVCQRNPCWGYQLRLTTAAISFFRKPPFAKLPGRFSRAYFESARFPSNSPGENITYQSLVVSKGKAKPIYHNERTPKKTNGFSSFQQIEEKNTKTPVVKPNQKYNNAHGSIKPMIFFQTEPFQQTDTKQRKHQSPNKRYKPQSHLRWLETNKQTTSPKPNPFSQCQKKTPVTKQKIQNLKSFRMA